VVLALDVVLAGVVQPERQTQAAQRSETTTATQTNSSGLKARSYMLRVIYLMASPMPPTLSKNFTTTL
jgi:hypothetical protein